MLKNAVTLWNWLIEGLTDAVMASVATLKKPRSIELLLGNGQGVLRESLGKALGQIVSFDGSLITDPPDLHTMVEDTQLDMIVPEALVLHRELNPLSAESMPFLDAFVRHQVERVTPWRATDTYVGISTNRLNGKPPKVAITIHAVAKRLLDREIAAARGLRPKSLRLLLPTQGRENVIVPLDDGATAQRAVIRKSVQVAVATIIGLIALRLAFFPAQIGDVQSQTADLDSQIQDQEAMLSQLHGGAGHFGAADLIAMRQIRPRAVQTLEDLSAALPDDDYLTSLQLSNDDLQVSGISNKISDLVPSLEGSKRFRAVSFAEPITRLQSGEGNKFHLSMHVAKVTKGATK